MLWQLPAWSRQNAQSTHIHQPSRRSISKIQVNNQGHVLDIINKKNKARLVVENQQTNRIAHYMRILLYSMF